MSLSDEVNAEIDGRKIDKLVNEGFITREEIANAPIVIICPNCSTEADASLDICPKCKRAYE